MKRIAALLIASCLLLTGCGSWMEGSYVSVTPYLSSNNTDGQDIQWVGNKEQLSEAIRYMVNQCVSEDVFFVRDYLENDLKTDMIMVRYDILSKDPMGAYAVQDIQFETGINGGRFTLAVKIDFSRQRSEILRMKTMQGVKDVESAVATALGNMDTELVFYIEDYQETDFAQIAQDYAQENPDKVIEIPRVSVSLYPETGENRVLELSFAYQTSREALRNMQNQVKQIFESAKLYVSGAESNYEKLSRLYVFLTGGIDTDRTAQQSGGSSITPSYSLLRYGVGDSKAFATVYAAMCRQAGVECHVVSGTRNGDAWFWNIVYNGEIYTHVDILRSVQVGYLRQRSDAEMGGYVWDYSEYPVCDGEYQATTDQTEEPVEETVEATEPTEQTDVTTAPETP